MGDRKQALNLVKNDLNAMAEMMSKHFKKKMKKKRRRKAVPIIEEDSSLVDRSGYSESRSITRSEVSR